MLTALLASLAFLALATLALDTPQPVRRRPRVHRVTDLRTGRAHEPTRAASIGVRGVLSREDRATAAAMARAGAGTMALYRSGLDGFTRPRDVWAVHEARRRWRHVA